MEHLRKFASGPFLVTIVLAANLAAGISSLFEQKWNEAFLYFMVTALFATVFFQQKIIKSTFKTIDSLFESNANLIKFSEKMLTKAIKDGAVIEFYAKDGNVHRFPPQ